MIHRIKKFYTDERAAEVTELAIVLALVVAGALATLSLLGPKIKDAYSTTSGSLP